MKNKDLIDRMAMRGHKKGVTRKVIDDLMKVITECLIEGEEVRIFGYGTFSVRDMKARKSTDVQTHEDIMLPEYRAVKFVPGATMKRAVREGILRD